MVDIGPGEQPADPVGDERRLRAIVVGWAAAAFVLGIGTVVIDLGAPVDLPLGVVVGLGLLAVALGVSHVRVVLRGSSEAITLSEVGIIPLIVLLPPHQAVVFGAAAGLVAEAIITGGQARKVVFNAAWQIVGLVAASWTFRGLAGTAGFAATPRPLLAALVAAGVFVVVNLVAIAAVIAATSHRRWSRVLAEEAVSSLLLGYGAAQVGIVAAVLVVEAPWGLPLLALPALLYRGRARARSEGLAGLAAERDRFQRIVAGSTDGVVLLDPDGRVQVWNPAMAQLTGVDERLAIGRHLQEVGWSELVEAGPPPDPSSDPSPDPSSHPSSHPAAGRGTEPPADRRLVRGGTTLAVRTSRPRSGTPDDGRTVLVVRDVSREVHLSRLQEDLVTRVSHEIRTPLTTVMGLLDTLQRHWDELPTSRREELVRVASRGARRLGRLISNLESLARIEARTTDVSGAADDVVEVVLVLDEVVHAPQRSEVPTVEVAGEPVVRASSEDVRLILENLIGNAELYGAPPVEVVVRAVGDEVVLSVSDHGPGVPPELRTQLFEPYTQGDVGLRRTTQGLGLGLAIVRSLAAASGGEVAHDDVPGGGSRFTVTLPAASPGGVSGPTR